MDTSEQYIAMCDCPEIQDGWEPKYWDDTNKGIITEMYTLDGVNCVETSEVFTNREQLKYRPRQDQLQDMFSKATHWMLLDLFVNTFDGIACIKATNIKRSGLKVTDYNSMEQLWLAFVMWELHSKKWTETKWIKLP